MNDLLSIRVKSFLYSLSGLIGTALIGVLVSDQFSALLSSFTGTTIWGSLIALGVSELIKHLRNKVVVGKAKKLAGETKYPSSVQLI